jgi:hypothetical protein
LHKGKPHAGSANTPDFAISIKLPAESSQATAICRHTAQPTQSVRPKIKMCCQSPPQISHFTQNTFNTGFV